MKLFCIPYAGGSAMFYQAWKNQLDPSIELCPLELAGRGMRIAEPLYPNMEELVADVAGRIRAAITGNDRYAIYGHSLGAAVAFEVSGVLSSESLPPQHLFVSGREAPHLETRDEKIHMLNDDEFMAKIYGLGGTPKEVLEQRELLDLFAPIIKSDYKISETYQYAGSMPSLFCPLTVLYGTQDSHKAEDVYPWLEHTSANAASRVYSFEGDHFFLNNSDHRTSICKIINRSLAPVNV